MRMWFFTLAATMPAFADCGAAEPTAVIVNQAADAVVNYLKLEKPLGKGATKEMVMPALHKLVDQYQGTGVSHVFWNVNYQRVGYRSAVWPSYWDTPDPEKDVTEWPRSYYELHKLGMDDVFAVVIPRCRERGISPWVSLRMNDHHYTSNPTRVSPLFFDHPELRINRGKGLFNYARPEVRDHYQKLIAEVLQRYDVDGIELDWIRTANNFNADELDRGREILTDFVREARRQTESAAKRRGHRVQLAVRVQATPDVARAMGFDVVGWARQGLVDMIIPSDWWNGFADTPVEEWRSQLVAGARACRIVPSTATTYACTNKGFMMSRNLAAMRGFAASMLDRGADGIYFFNNFQAADSTVRLRTPEGRETIDCRVADLFRAARDLSADVSNLRVHALAIHDGVPSRNDHRYALPAKISPQEGVTFKIHIGPKPTGGRCVVRVGLDQSDDLAAAELGVRWNGAACRALEDMSRPAKPDPRLEQPRMNTCELAPRMVQFDAPPAACLRGYNTVELTVKRGGPQTVIWLEVLIDPAALSP